jgi:hypothetical protein
VVVVVLVKWVLSELQTLVARGVTALLHLLLAHQLQEVVVVVVVV